MSSAKRKASPPPAGRGKRKRVVLTISQKLEICDLVTSRRLSYGDIARKYGIGRQTVADIKKGEGLARVSTRRVSTRFYYPDNLGYTDTRESASAQHCLDNRGRTVPIYIYRMSGMLVPRGVLIVKWCQRANATSSLKFKGQIRK